MTPAARVQAAIELLDEIIFAARDGGPAADSLIARYFKTRRYAGSKDRRAVRDHVYAAIRRAGERPDSGRAAMVGLARAHPHIAALFNGSPHGPAPIVADEPGAMRSEEHTSELQSLMRISYAVFCLQKQKKAHKQH